MPESVAATGHVPGTSQSFQRRRRNFHKTALTGKGLSANVGNGIEAFTISDSARASTQVGHASDSFGISDSVGFVTVIPPRPSLFKLLPGIGGRATPRTRNPVNAPRYFKVSRVPPPAHLTYNSSDLFSISDAATRSSLPSFASASDSFSITEQVKIGLNPSDLLSLSDLAKITARGLGVNDSVTISDSARASSSVGRASDIVAIGDTAVGTPGRNTANLFDSVPILDAPLHGPNAYDTLSFTDSGQAGPVFFAGYDNVPVSENGVILAGFCRGFVFQEGAEVITAPSSAAFVYQSGGEVGVEHHSRADVYQYGIEIIVQNVRTGQIWPRGSVVPRPNNGLLWPRWNPNE